jgi:hypothetical protein
LKMARFETTDYLRHAPDETGRMRDSLFWQTIFGPEQLGFQAYLYLTAAGKAGFNVILWQEGKPKGFDRIEGEIPPDMDLDDFKLEGLSLRNTGVGEAAHITYQSDRVQFDLHFTGSHPPFSYHDNPDGLPSWMARNRFEQGGQIKGWIKARDIELEVDQPAHRDHSWGNRNWGMPQHWKWFCAYTPDGAVTLNGWIWMARGEMGCAGFVCRGGKLLPLATIRHQAAYDDDMSQRSLSAVLVDVEGGETKLELERFGLIKLPTGDKIGTIIQEAACNATIDGAKALGQFETQWHQSYLDHLIETRSTR